MAKKSESKPIEEVQVEVETPLPDLEFERRTKLDVSDPQYLNPSLEHGK
jgi:hypothetical protein